MIFSEQIELQASLGLVEIFYLEIKPEHFNEILQSNKVMVKIGNTRINLKENEINALNDLSNLIPPLDYKKFYSERPKYCSNMME